MPRPAKPKSYYVPTKDERLLEQLPIITTWESGNLVLIFKDLVDLLQYIIPHLTEQRALELAAAACNKQYEDELELLDFELHGGTYPADGSATSLYRWIMEQAAAGNIFSHVLLKNSQETLSRLIMDTHISHYHSLLGTSFMLIWSKHNKALPEAVLVPRRGTNG